MKSPLEEKPFSTFRINFIQDLDAGDYFWRICKLSSLIDLIFLKVSEYLSHPTNEKLVEIFNSCMKAKIVFRLGEIDIKKLEPKSIAQKIEEEIPEIIAAYDSELTKFSQMKITIAKGALFEEQNYLRTYIDLNLLDFPEEILDQILLKSQLYYRDH